MSKIKAPILLLVLTMTIGCSNKLIDEAEQVKAQAENSVEEKSEDTKKSQKDLEKVYEDMERPVKEVFEENDFEKVNQLINEDGIELKKHYEDSTAFAIFAGNMLYNFQASEISPSAFYDFLKQYGSESIQEGLQIDRKDAITSFENVQDIYKNSKQQPKSYELSEVQITAGFREGYFYRKVATNKGDDYYITTIKQEDGNWKFVDDSPSPPYEAAEVMEKGEEDSNDKSTN
ncbi:hypothetical protein IQ283_09060 (plasmid) [Alkalihalobacillus hwajinpoensis]|uniref:hypothetical protein n=1 Tax=Guptibacillus hwajinpoensis TaxID=208199 RepID=UPI00188430C3|nr:hypothetical protein [Pseudalkalibacillus hwajinpoensis]MBF0706756.1 hypothetical protein [Pseudalkalibacillus hwajinpoensis]